MFLKILFIASEGQRKHSKSQTSVLTVECSTTELQGTRGRQDHIPGLHVTRVLHAARSSNVDSVYITDIIPQVPPTTKASLLFIIFS